MKKAPQGHSLHSAFTMLELVFVIVVIGILAAAIIPSTRTNPVQEAAIQLLSHIRYTQHLAMMDDKYGDNTGTNWYKKRWQIRFNGNQYSIVSDNNTIFAVDPSNSSTNLSNIDLNAEYSVSIVITGTECGTSVGGEHIISFDHLGRPISGDIGANTGAYTGAQLVQTNDCAIALSANGETATLNITPETGYASITF